MICFNHRLKKILIYLKAKDLHRIGIKLLLEIKKYFIYLSKHNVRHVQKDFMKVD
jgi:hypothetical protein